MHNEPTFITRTRTLVFDGLTLIVSGFDTEAVEAWLTHPAAPSSILVDMIYAFNVGTGWHVPMSNAYTLENEDSVRGFVTTGETMAALAPWIPGAANFVDSVNS